MLNGNKLRPPSTQSQKIWITTAITGDFFFSSGSNQNLTWAIDPESLRLLEILHSFVFQRQNSNGKKNEYDYTALYQRNEIKIERRAWDWISGLFILWATGGDIKRFKQASKRNNEKWNKTGRGCCIIKFVRRLKNKREREKYYLLLILCQVRLPMWLQPVPVCGEYHSFLSLRESAIDGPENLFLLLLRLTSVCMTFIYQRFTMGPLQCN